MGPLRGFVLEPAALTVIEGDNEAGKSSIVDALHSWLRERFHRANAPSWPGVRRQLYEGGAVEVELAGDAPDPPSLLCDNPLLWNLLVIPEGRASVRGVGSADWVDEAKRHLTGFDPGPLRASIRSRAGLTPTDRDAQAWTVRGEELAARRERIERLLGTLDAVAEAAERLVEARGALAELEREAQLERRAVDFERYDLARRALAEHAEAGRSLAGLQRYGADDLRSWRELDKRRAAEEARRAAARETLDTVERDLERAADERRAIVEEHAAAERDGARIAGSGIVGRADRAARDLAAAEGLRAGSPLRIALAALCGLSSAALVAAGALGGPGLLLLLAVPAGGGAAALWLRDASVRRRWRDAAGAERAVVDDARRLGLGADGAGGVRPAAEQVAQRARSLADRLEMARTAVRRLDSRGAGAREAARMAARAVERTDDELRRLRERSGLADLGDLERHVERRSHEEQRRRGAEAVLRRLFPACGSETWAAAVARAVVEDPGRAPSPGRLAELEARCAAGREDVARLVEATDGRLRDGLTRAGEESLDSAHASLGRIAAEQLDRRRLRAAGRLALDAIDAAEKDVDGHLDRVLGDEEHGAGPLFRAFSGGSWTGIRRRPGGFEAVGRDGGALPVEALSRGAADQLHIALRVSLAEQVLGRPGFFLWDDTLLTADAGRRRALVATAVDLVQRGWQILYLTVDPTIAELFETQAARRVGLLRRRLSARASATAQVR